MKYGYWVDLQGKQFFDSGGNSWIHALPVGKYEHPEYGALDFTAEKVQNFALSVNSRVRGIDPDIDYDHKDKTGKAAGWVKTAEARPDGLYLNIDWTPAAAAAIKAGEYRYFSPEFDDEWIDPQGVKHSDVLFGGALTNRPFLKDLLPVNLSEITSTQPQGGMLDPKKLRAALKLGEDADEAAVLAAIAKLGTQTVPPPTPPTPTPAPTQLGEVDIAKLLADSPIIKTLQEQVAAGQQKLAESERLRQVESVKHRLGELTGTDNGRKFVLPPAVVDAVAEGISTSDATKMSEGVIKALEQLAKTGFVELGERGRATGVTGTEKSPQQLLAEASLTVRANHFKATGKQLSYADAMRAIVRQNPGLYEEYRKTSYAGQAGEE